MTQLLRWRWEFFAPVFGVLLALAFAPYDCAVFAWISLVFFYCFSKQQAPKQAAWSGYLFGLGLFGYGIWWVYVSIHYYGGASTLNAGLLTGLLVALWALFPALTAYLSARILVRNERWLRMIGFAVIWVFLEYIRGHWLLNGFPWLQIAYSQLNTPLTGYIPLMGVYGTGFLLALTSALIAEFFLNICNALAALCLLLIMLGGLGLKEITWNQPIGPSITVTLVQGNIDQGQKWQENQQINTLNLYRQLTEQHWDSDIIIWPETAIPAFLSAVKGVFLDPIAKQARATDTDLIVSLPVEGEGKDYFNSIMTLGRHDGIYHKRHLLPFGEYLPLQPISGWVLEQLDIPLGDFAVGEANQPLLTAMGYPFVSTVCYEDAFGELVSPQVEQAAFLVNVSNDAWFGNTSEPYQHMQMAQMRALETGRYMLRATNTGLTGFVRPDGRISKQAPMFTTTTLTDIVVPMQGMTPYARIGDLGVFSGLLFLLLTTYGFMRFRQHKCT